MFIVLWMTMYSCQSQPTTQLVDAPTFKEMIRTQKSPVILDVRSPEEYSEGYIEHAVNINYNDPAFERKVSQMDKEGTYFVYCLAGGRSNSAASYMRKQGFLHVFDLDGGIRSWKKSNFPLVMPPDKK